MPQRRQRKQQGSYQIIGDRWFVRYWRQVNQNGVMKRVRASHPLGAVEGRERKHPPRSVVEAGELHLAQVNRPNAVPERAGLSIAQFVEQVYLPRQDQERRPSTSWGTRRLWEKHIKVQTIQVGRKHLRCADLLVDSCETYHVQAWLEAILATSSRPLSASVLKQAKFILSGAFRLALQRGYRSSSQGNPVTPCCVPSGALRQQPTFAYTFDELMVMLNIFEEPARTIVALAAATGLRVGELQALRWEDINGNTLLVSRSVWRNHVNEPKTASSAAPVALPWQIVDLLERVRAKDGNPNSGPIFRTGKESALSLHNVRCRQILPVLNACVVCGKTPGKGHAREQHEYQRNESLPQWRGWHAFRRALATSLQHNGMEISVAQGALRHADPGITLRAYTKQVPGAVRQALQQHADQLGSCLTDSNRTPNRLLSGNTEVVN